MPTADDAAPFADWIERLAETHGGPIFVPHVTLLGEVAPASDAAIDGVLRSRTPFPVTLVGLADSDARFRCITVTAEREAPLVELHAALADACGVDGTPYEPHLSLLYAEMRAPERARVRNTVDLPLPRVVTVDAVHLVDTTDEASRWSIQREWVL